MYIATCSLPPGPQNSRSPGSSWSSGNVREHRVLRARVVRHRHAGRRPRHHREARAVVGVRARSPRTGTACRAAPPRTRSRPRRAAKARAGSGSRRRRRRPPAHVTRRCPLEPPLASCCERRPDRRGLRAPSPPRSASRSRPSPARATLSPASSPARPSCCAAAMKSRFCLRVASPAGRAACAGSSGPAARARGSR